MLSFVNVSFFSAIEILGHTDIENAWVIGRVGGKIGVVSADYLQCADFLAVYDVRKRFKFSFID